jgi:hypothetical protein
MQEIAEYRGYAEDCRRMARTASNPEDKRRLMEMATVWALLASEREAEINQSAELSSNGRGRQQP